ncbi:CTD kinase subunit gamma CTK3-domain-containing protein [Microdochium trichocladiopsis]|uniref:CTD kinase subunit gamma CTK3-domain-containing protein n=1 Tax=Microdochium trichocladiopsis TaxID=1682393 RepID=A0A9P8YF55_9PEZI|nr:CTD kinase subunit gamma CTK3-domain-containing protein [Microdochium trichocladiopsis]KAH7038089.1 CTD kinase subunit gamma CTK3-domain-containing protein [Microdochium trichocladiopsis]
MADPFEVRMHFSRQLQHLNASSTSAQKAAQYALKHKDLHEDLHSCILEQLEKSNMNTRANIMFFIEHFLEMASKAPSDHYVHMMQRDIIRVVDAVCPEDGSGVANVKVVRKVLQGLKNKSILLEQTVVELEECLKERDASTRDLAMSSPMNGVESSTANSGVGSNNSNRHSSANAAARSRNGAQGGQPGSHHGLDKRQVEQRIEEDRERHKRMRESMWLVPTDFKQEASEFYDETSDLDDDHHLLGEEEMEEFRRDGERVLCKHLKAKNGAITA